MNRTAKGSICRVSAFFAEIKALRQAQFKIPTQLRRGVIDEM
ncbi:hypothetical protein [Sporosarcina sp. FSL K6-2383]